MTTFRFSHHLSPMCAAILLTLVAQHANAQPPTTTKAQAIAAGKAFSTSMLPTIQANPVSATANPASALPTNAPTNSPFYTTTQPASNGFGSGIGLVTQGSAAITKCQNYTPTGNKMADQECAGVNFLAKNPIQSQFVIQPTDPARTAFNTAAAAVTATNMAGQQCVMKTITTASIFEQDMCSQSLQIDTFTCNKQLIAQCAYVASPISLLNINSTGDVTGTLTPLAEAGTYSFTITTGSTKRNRGTTVINFNLDSIGFGSYININLNSIDDAGAVAVNGIPVWAGYPNNGPAYTYSALGSPTAATFVQNYSWTETDTTPATAASTGYDADGFPYTIAATPAQSYTGSFSAATKILDTCPNGYAPMQLALPSCTLDENGNQSCSTQGADTSRYIQGFFCNGNGQFLMNGHEGNGSSAANLGNNFPLVRGLNTIQVFWGTYSQASNSGRMTVTGTIYNVAPKCTSSWNDGCASPRSSLAP